MVSRICCFQKGTGKLEEGESGRRKNISCPEMSEEFLTLELRIGMHTACGFTESHCPKKRSINASLSISLHSSVFIFQLPHFYALLSQWSVRPGCCGSGVGPWIAIDKLSIIFRFRKEFPLWLPFRRVFCLLVFNLSWQSYSDTCG